YPSRLDAPTGVGYVVRTGEPLCRKIDEHELRRVTKDQRHLDLLLELGLRSAVVVPLVARGRTLGALTLVTAESARDYHDTDLPHVQELARRCAFAVDNARLYREAQRELAQRKQTEQELKHLNETLEERVSEGTALAERRAGQLRGLASELATAEQRERRRLAQTLHDDHQQLLVAAKLQVSMLRQSAALEQTEGLSKVDELLEEAVSSARTVSRELSPAVLYDAGLAAALRWLATVKREKYGLSVHVEADEGADPVAEDVSTFLYQAVRELLLNIVKHADTSEVWVRMTPAPDEEVQIEVRDQGRGFDTTTMNEHGANAGQFGLFGMRERLSLFGGRLRVDSRPGDGTCVTLLVPRRSEGGGDGGEGADRLARVQQPAGRSGGKRDAIRVLLADDHKMLRDGLAGLLRAEPDIELVAEAEDGEEALALAEQWRPDVVVMDVSMPGVNGIEATRRLRRELPAIAVVGLSMHDSKEMADAMRAAGAAVYLSKDGAASTLVEAIRTHGTVAAE
ncbi:MAG: response regulator, partial [Halofilum sp. (in: g-proteobacteria)]